MEVCLCKMLDIIALEYLQILLYLSHVGSSFQSTPEHAVGEHLICSAQTFYLTFHHLRPRYLKKRVTWVPRSCSCANLLEFVRLCCTLVGFRRAESTVVYAENGTAPLLARLHGLSHCRSSLLPYPISRDCQIQLRLQLTVSATVS